MAETGNLSERRAGFYFNDAVPIRAQLYISAVTFVGLPVFFYSLYQSLFSADLHWLYLIGPTVIASYFPVKIPLARGKAQSFTLTTGEVFIFAALLLFNPQVAAVLAVTEGFVSNLRVRVKKLYKRLFNLGQLSLVAFLVGHIFYQLSGRSAPLDRSSLPIERFLVEMALCALLYFILNTGSVAVVMNLATGQTFLDLWRQNFLWILVGNLTGAFLGAFVFRYFGEFQFYSIAVVFPIVVVMYFGYKATHDRIFQAQQHLKEVNDLLAKKIEAEKALQKANEELEMRVQARTVELRNANQLLLMEINERRLTEKALAAEKDRLAVTLVSIGEGVITADTEGKIFLMNRVAEEITGWTQDAAYGQPLLQIFQIVDRQTGRPCHSSNGADFLQREGSGLSPRDNVLIARDGTEKNVSHTLAPIRDKAGRTGGLVLVFHDITKQLQMEDELVRAQKLESLGILAGGIAHDFNNILSGILMKTQLALRALGKGNDPTRFLTSVEDATQLATGLTQQLLTFAKGGEPIKETLLLKELLLETAVFSLRGSKVRCKFEISEDLWPCEVDKGQLSQVINNLVINAVQAMPNGGTIRVEAENVQLASDQSLGDLPEGAYVKVSVHDEGVGIAPADLGRIFDPYFTTKAKGHGLGLTTSHSIIEKHGGRITVQSELEKGSTFTLYLPAVPKGDEKTPDKIDVVAHGTGRVLVMDDERIIRDSIGELLGELGYRTEFANDGAQALALYERALTEGDPILAVIMDLTIAGGMGGKEAIQKLLAIDPTASAIVCSGYSKDPVMADFRSYGFSAVLVKPFRIEEVSRVLAEVQESKSPFLN